MSEDLSDYKISDKINSIKETLHRLGSSLGQNSMESSIRPPLLPRIDSTDTLNTQRSLEKFLEQRYMEDRRRIEIPSKGSTRDLSAVAERSVEYSRDEPSYSPFKTYLHPRSLRNSHSAEDLREDISPRFPIHNTYETESPDSEYYRRINESRIGGTSGEGWEFAALENERVKVQELEERLANKDRILNDMTRLQGELLKTLDDHKREIQFLSAQTSDDKEKLRVQLDSTRKAYSDLEVKNRELQEKNFYLETEADNLRKRVNVYEMENKNKDKAGHGLEQTVYELESSLERVKSERNKAMLERDEAYSHIERLETEIKERKQIESELIHTKARDDSLNEYVEKLERENYKLRDQIDSYRRSEERLKSDNLELSAELKKLQDYNSKISTRIDETRQVIESECHKRFSHIKEEDSLKILMLEKRLQSLENEKENLLMELESRPTHKQVKENLRRISELEELLKTQPPSSHSPILTSHISREKMRKDRELHSLTTGRLPSHSTLRRLLRDLMEELQVENVGDLLPAVQKLKSSGSVLKLYERLKELMIELSPEGRIEVIKPKHVWKWVRNLTEKYMELKKF